MSFFLKDFIVFVYLSRVPHTTFVARQIVVGSGLQFVHGLTQGRIQDLKKGGGGGTTHFSDRRQHSIESCASPKKADERLFFRSATSVESRARGGGG